MWTGRFHEYRKAICLLEDFRKAICLMEDDFRKETSTIQVRRCWPKWDRTRKRTFVHHNGWQHTLYQYSVVPMGPGGQGGGEAGPHAWNGSAQHEPQTLFPLRWQKEGKSSQVGWLLKTSCRESVKTSGTLYCSWPMLVEMISKWLQYKMCVPPF